MPTRTPQRRRAAVHTLGCRLNQSESQLLTDRLIAEGFEIVPFDAPADLGIINTCTVTRLAESKCRQVIRGFVRRNPEAFTAVIGCYSQTGAAEIAEIPGIDLIVGNQDKMALLDFARAGKNERPVVLRERIDRSDFSITFADEVSYPQRANLKIQDGCDFVCSFCIIPKARGPSRAREFENLIAEARLMAARGVREVVLTGVNVGTYRSEEHGIIEIVDALHAIEGIERIRISSIEPTTVPWGLIDRMADETHTLVPYLHLPLQAGCDRTLMSMRRRYSLNGYRVFVREAVERVPHLCLGTDIMVGYPGESGRDFEASCRFFEEEPFAYAHVFTFSERPGTPASRMSDPVAVEERQRRSVYLRRLSAAKRAGFMQRFVGREMRVLFERPREKRWSGLTSNYIRVIASEPDGLTDRFARVRLERLRGEVVQGRVLSVE